MHGEPCWGSRCMTRVHVAVSLDGGVGQPCTWGGSLVHAVWWVAQMSPRALVTFARFGTCVCARCRLRVRSWLHAKTLCMFLSCFALSKRFTCTCIIPICAVTPLKISFTPPSVRHRELTPLPTNMTSTAILRVCSGSLAAARKGRSRACHFGTTFKSWCKIFFACGGHQ